MSDSSARSHRDFDPPEAQVSSRLTAVYAAGSGLAFILIAVGIVTAWPRWRWGESTIPERPSASSASRFYRGRSADDSPNATTRWAAGSRSDAAALRSSRKEPPTFPLIVNRSEGRKRSGAALRGLGQPAGLDASSEEDADLSPGEDEAASGEATQRAARQRDEGEPVADEMEAAAQRARRSAEAEADEFETRAEAAYEAAEEAFSRGQLDETALSRARQVADQAREHAEAMREAAETAEGRELARARRVREAAIQAEEHARQQVRVARDEAPGSR
jgi:hypothetical protein